MSVTRADVARRAGVSPALVSYVLNPGLRPVAADTRERILRAIDELGYRPNPVAQTLRGGVSHSIGILVPDLANPYFAELMRALEDSAFRRGFLALMGSTEDDPKREKKYIRSFLDRSVDAIIMIGPISEDIRLRLASSGKPVLLFDRRNLKAGELGVTVDPLPGSLEAARHLAKLGHRKTAMVAGPEGDETRQLRVEAWRKAAHAAGMAEPTVVHKPFTQAGGSAGAMEILKEQDALPTAILASSDVQALGVLAAASQLGLKVPEDVSVISFDGTLLAAYAQPPLSSIDQPLEELAEAAVSLVIDKDHEATANQAQPVEIPTRFSSRKSTAAPQR